MQSFRSFSLQGPTQDAAIIRQRVWRRLGRWEFFGLAFCLAFVGIFLWLITVGGGYPVDFETYMEKGISPRIFYGYWIVPFFDLLKNLPFLTAYGIFSVVNLAGAFFALRVFGGKSYFVLLSYQLLTSIYYGQITGIVVGGLGLCWWGITQKKWDLAGLGLLIAATKYQVGLLALIFIWYSGISWKTFLRMLVVPVGIGLISMVVYPLWPLEIIQKLSMFSYIHLGITAWIYIGAWALLLWLPAVLLPLNRDQRFFSLFVLVTFATPYFQHIDLISLFSMPLGWLPLIGAIGALYPLLNIWAVRLVALAPVLIYLRIILPAGGQWIRRLRSQKG